MTMTQRLTRMIDAEPPCSARQLSALDALKDVHPTLPACHESRNTALAASLAAAAAAAVVADTAAASDKASVYRAVAVYCVGFFAVQHPTSFASSHVCRVLICNCRAKFGMWSSGGTLGLCAPGAESLQTLSLLAIFDPFLTSAG